MMRAMCGVELNVRKRATCFMFMLRLNKYLDQLVMAIGGIGYVLRKEHSHCVRWALECEVEGQKKKWRTK